ncbi:phage tail protein [Oscillospiraceae bacterium N12]|uniref:Phage tail protein n=1 Tax=Jilunia laotingensis TaxID=2763675 RepID=A0A926F5U0_9BACT|nr:phage tail protein [Jilunia laotingensis]MBC8592444.1 phage tail protein [Jilunia laotingensis]
MAEEKQHNICQPTAFYFNLQTVGSSTRRDIDFLEVFGFSAEMESQEIDGHQRYVPGSMRHGNIICKRPIRPLRKSELSLWTSQMMPEGANKDLTTCDLLITLLSPTGTREAAWLITKVYLVKWDVAGFDLENNDVALETIEFAYDTIQRIQ